MEKRLQIGIMGAGHDLEHSERVKQLAFELGERIARAGHILVYGANKDEETLPTDSARGAKSAGGLVIGVTYYTGLDVLHSEVTDVVIASGSEKGGGREFVLVNSCHVVILISGGAGTLVEATIAYEMNIPIVALVGTGGIADKIANTYLDTRNRIFIEPAETPREALEKAISLARKAGH